MADEREYRVVTGWVEIPPNGLPFAIVQQGGLICLDEAMERAKEIEGWVEKDGKPAHVASGTDLTGKGNG